MQEAKGDDAVQASPVSPPKIAFEVIEEEKRADGVKQFDIRFAVLVYLPIVLFFTLMALCSVVTFTSTDFEKDTDAVYRLFDTFNPCLLFDHYPANVVGVVFTALYCLSMMTYVSVLWLFLSKLNLPATLLTHSVGLVIAFLMFAAFPNVFTANLYFGPNAIVLSSGDLTAIETDKLTEHVIWYTMMLLANLFLLVSVMFTHRRLAETRSITWKYGIVFFLSFYAFILAPCGQLLSVTNYNGAADVWSDTPDTFMQSVVAFAKNYTLVSSWAWVMLFVFPLTLGRTQGIRVKVSLISDREDRKTVSPQKMIASSFVILGVLVILTYLNSDPVRSDDSRLIFAAGFTEEPFKFLFTPVWMILIFKFSIASALHAIRAHLQFGHDAWRWRIITALCVTMSICMLLGIWETTPEFNSRGWPLIPFLFLFPVLVYMLDVHDLWKPQNNLTPVVFGVAWYASVALALTSGRASSATGNALLLGCVLAYAYVGDYFKQQENRKYLKVEVQPIEEVLTPAELVEDVKRLMDRIESLDKEKVLPPGKVEEVKRLKTRMESLEKLHGSASQSPV